MTCPQGHHIKTPANWWMDTVWCAECRRVYAAEQMTEPQPKKRLSLYETS